MPTFNNIDLKNWKECDVWTDSLWLIENRDKSGKHDGFYHGNFVPQIPNQLIKRYTKENDLVVDLFLGSGTTTFECERLNRKFLGVEIQRELLKSVFDKLDIESKHNFIFINDDCTSESTLKKILIKLNKLELAQLIILHPPYFDIIKFSNLETDLSNIETLDGFINKFNLALKNSKSILKKNGYLSIIIGDKFSKGEWVPLGFLCMNEALKLGFKLKSIIVKDMKGNRSKQNKEAIWRYRALSSDYYIFKHEYIFIFKN